MYEYDFVDPLEHQADTSDPSLDENTFINLILNEAVNIGTESYSEEIDSDEKVSSSIIDSQLITEDEVVKLLSKVIYFFEFNQDEAYEVASE